MSAHAQPVTSACVADLLADASTCLIESLALDKQVARLEARVLAASAWNVGQVWLIAHDTDMPSPEQVTTFHTLLHRRLRGEPIAYITGQREFYGRPFHVTPDVLIPRPETELLVELALARMPNDPAFEVLELGTGSGCIAISLALEVARLNAVKWQADLELVKSDWFTQLGSRKFDLIVSNPPYVSEGDPHLNLGDVRFEPLPALASGKEGMDDLRFIISLADSHLKAGGSLLLEHGWTQSMSTQNSLHAAGFEALRTWPDLAGRDRVSEGWRRNSLQTRRESKD
jgi:release factor glutamine methyltransferase